LLFFLAVELRVARGAREQVKLFAFRSNYDEGAFDFQYGHTAIISRLED
jgi:hypothetical protein